MKAPITCVIVGSFRKHYSDILSVIKVFKNLGISILSPSESKIVDSSKQFVILESDIETFSSLSIEDIEGKVLDRINDCDFVYLCNPDGYVGTSSAFEIGYAHSIKKKILAMYVPNDPLISEYVCEAVSPNSIMNNLEQSFKNSKG